jgi:hypothetical protein
MTTRERRALEHLLTPASAGENEPPVETDAREQGDAFLRAADSAIDRALSGRAEDFLRQNRQLGGE